MLMGCAQSPLKVSLCVSWRDPWRRRRECPQSRPLPCIWILQRAVPSCTLKLTDLPVKSGEKTKILQKCSPSDRTVIVSVQVQLRDESWHQSHHARHNYFQPLISVTAVATVTSSALPQTSREVDTEKAFPLLLRRSAECLHQRNKPI